MIANELRRPPISPSYDPATILFHWATALLVCLQWGGATAMNLVDDRPSRLVYWTFHICLGTLLLIVLLARLYWRLYRGRKLPPVGTPAQRLAASVMHRVLYFSIFTLTALGIAIVLLRGWILIGLFKVSPIIAGAHDFSTRLIHIHGWGGHALMSAVLIHALAALWHHRVQEDGVLLRMHFHQALPGTDP